MKLTDFSLKKRTAIFVFVAVITFAGIGAYINLPIESFPEIKQPTVFVTIPYPGVSPKDMETLVADPLETRLMEISKLKTLSSSSREGLTSVVAEFQPDIAVDEAVRQTREKVDQARSDLPNDILEPIVQEINFENIPVIVVAVTGDQSLVRLKEIAQDLKKKLENIPGVLTVNLTGGLEREIKVNVNPTELVHYNLGVDDVISAISRENMTIPGGATESSSLRWTIRVPGELTSLDDLRGLVIDTRHGTPIYLRDVAMVSSGFKEPESASRLNGQPSVSLAVEKRTGENILALTDAVKALLAKEQPGFPEGAKAVVVADFSREIRTTVSDLNNHLLMALLLVVFVLYFFMGARNSLLVGLAVPLSMFLSFLTLSLLGLTLNMITLFSLILSLGMLVDDAIVVVENIYRQHHEGKKLMEAARDATREVGIAVISSTATTVFAFAPLLFWPGIIGNFMRVLPVTLIITLSSSLLVALMISPVFASAFIRLKASGRPHLGDRLLNRFGARYERMLGWLLASRKRRGRFLALSGAAFVLMLVVFAVLNHGVEFFPDQDPAQIYVNVEAPLGTRLEVSDAAVREIERRLAGTPDVRNVLSDIGTSGNFFDFGAGGGTPHKSRVTIDMLDKPDRKQSSVLTLEQVRAKVAGIPGVRVDVTKPENGPPTGRAVEVRLKGKDLAVLDAMSVDIQKRIAGVPGLARLDDDYEPGRPELRVDIDRVKAALQGLSTAKIAGTIRTAINGTVASKYRVGSDQYDITVRFDRDYRTHYNDLLDLTVLQDGVHRPLANFATVHLATGLSSINHVGGERVITVSADAIGRSSAEVLAEARNRLASYVPPQGYALSFTGQNEEQAKAASFLASAFLIAMSLIFLMLVVQFDSVTVPFVIMATVPLSLFGAFFGLLVTFKPFGIIMTGVGIISLAGVVVKNAIVLIEYTRQLRERGLPKAEAIVRAGRTRLRPVLLTAITAILGLIPLTTGIAIEFTKVFQGNFHRLITFGAESADFWSGMGVVVIFGLMFATVLTLVVVPVMYYALADLPQAIGDRLARRRARREAAQAERTEKENGEMSA